nr:S6 family peptidase [Pantoea agglomerans]MBD8132775.1 autotransporter outer membrane beta-barrel domain-containing protein [Pantoea agglomerans]
MKNIHIASYCTLFVCLTSYAGIMRHDISIQDYRDFGENLGKYRPGVTNIPVYKVDGTLSGYLAFSMPDFGAVSTSGYATLISPSYIASVRHNTGYKSVTFGNGARFSTTYLLINRNEHSSVDFHAPRLNKVVTEAASVDYVDKSGFLADYKSRYTWYTRVGAGTQDQVNESETGRIQLSGAYKWKSGGTISTESVRSLSDKNRIQYLDLGPDDPFTTPLSIGAMSGDSGSPVFGWDKIAEKWKLVAVHGGSLGDPGVYNKRAYAPYIPDDFVSSIQVKNSSPDITDSSQGGIISWSGANITQNDRTWAWQGLADKYKNQAPSVATLAELDATKDLRFNGVGGVIQLQDSVNMGAGKLQFSENYTLSSAENVNATWVGGGVEVDTDKTVLWQVNGLAGDTLHKIGGGTLHVNASGNNPGVLNVGDGTVFLDQQADAEGKKQAFSTVTLVSGRPTVVLANAQQINTNNVRFGYRGGTLDLNGNNLTFKEIRHTDSGARLVNHNASKAASLTLTGNITDTLPLQTWTSTGKGIAGDIYQYKNPYSGNTEYFFLNKTSYGYFPTNQTSNSTWTYLGTDFDAITKDRLEPLNNAVFRGFIGEIADDKNNGKLDLNINIRGETSKITLAGGMNLNGNLNIKQGTTLLSGQPVPHADGVVDDWATSYFKADQIAVGDNLTFQVGEYAEVSADVIAGKSSRLMFGYNNSQYAQDRIWRCYSVINSDETNCSQPTLSQNELSALPYSSVTGDVSLDSKASLYLGKVNYLGSVSSADDTTMTLDPSAYWILSADSNVTTLNALSGSRVSMLPSGTWKPKMLSVDTLDASGLTLSMGVNPVTEESDKLTIKNSALGGHNILDVSLMMEPSQTVSLMNDLVMIDAPAGTSHNYFAMPDINLGFSVYSPNYDVKDNNGRVQWVLQHNAEQTPDSDAPEPVVPVQPEPAAPEPVVPVQPEPAAPEPTVPVQPEPATPEPTVPVQPESVAPVQPEPAAPEPVVPVQPEPAAPEPVVPVQPEPAAPEPTVPVQPEPVASESSETAEEAESAEPSEAEVMKPFSPDDWFTIADNKLLLKRTRALMASRQYLFSEALSSMSDRTSLLRAMPEKSGEWVTIEQNQGSWDELKMTQRTLSVGWDTASHGQIFGLSTSYTQGTTKGNGQVTHRLITTGADYSWSSPAGWFMDLSGRYMYLSQEFSFDSDLHMKDTKVNSSMLAGGVKAGYAFHLDQDSLTLTPYIGVKAGIMPGNTIKGDDASIALSSSAPYYAISGLEVIKSGLWAARSDITLSAGVEYQYAPGRSGSELTLSDRYAARKYDALSDNRYRVHAGIEGKLSQNLSVNAKVKSSFGGTFTSDYGGLVGISYHFR